MKAHRNIRITVRILPFLFGPLILLASTASLKATDYYIDVESRGGACSNRNPGTIQEPWCSWSVVVWDMKKRFDPGDKIFIRGGTYFERFHFHGASLFSGTPSNPIVIQPYPGEKVVFDGSKSGGNGLYIAGNHSYIHLTGPLEFRNYSKCMEANGAEYNEGWVIDNIDFHDCGTGLKIRKFRNLTLKNSRIHDTNDDGEAAGVMISGTSDDILIENVKSYNHNDGRGTDGDADGFWADETTGKVVMRNVESWGNSEDGFDIKGANITIINAKSHDNTTVGFKLWFGHYDVQNFLTYNNGEDGVKCSGADMNVSNLVSVGNYESGLQFRSTSCTGEVRNSIFANNRESAIAYERPAAGNTVNVHFKNNIFSHPNDPARTIVVSHCGNLISASDVTDGSFDQKLRAGFCGGPYGTVTGSNEAGFVQDPRFINSPAIGVSSRMSAQTAQGDRVTVFVDGNNPWPGYQMGHQIELNNDGVLRELTGVDDISHVLTFSGHPLAEPYSGRRGDGKGVRIMNWGTRPLFNTTGNYHLNAGSPAIDAGTDAGAPLSDLDGLSRRDDPGVPNAGSSFVDLGVYEFGSTTPGPALGGPDPAALIVVDHTLGGDCLGRTYSFQKRTCSEPDGSGVRAYNTVQEALDTVEPGETISIREGTYQPDPAFTQSNIPFLWMKHSGTEASPIIIQAAIGENVILDADYRKMGVLWVQGDYIIIEDLTFIHSITVGLSLGERATPANHVTVRRCVARDNSTRSPQGGGPTGFSPGFDIRGGENNVIEYCHSYRNGNGIRLTALAQEDPSTGSKFCTIQYNMVYEMTL